MPLYEYQCESCGCRFEVLQRMGAGAEGLECPTCGTARVGRALSTFAAAPGSGGAAASCAPGGGFS